MGRHSLFGTLIRSSVIQNPPKPLIEILPMTKALFTTFLAALFLRSGPFLKSSNRSYQNFFQSIHRVMKFSRSGDKNIQL